MTLPVLITGGCGFIGSNFVRYLLETDPTVSVINFDALTYAGNLANLADLTRHPRYRFVHGDITDAEAVHRVVKAGVSAILHFAAESHVDRSIHDSGPFVPHQYPGHAGSARRRPRLPCAPLPSSVDRRSLRQPRRHGCLHRRNAARPQQPLCRKQGVGRFARTQLCSYLRATRRHHALLE